MSTSASPASRPGRETRLLLVTIAVSVGVLLLLARFRFPPESVTGPVESAPAPLERLAAQATYEELASIMADLERRITSRTALVRTTDEGGTAALVVAPRIAPDRAVALARAGDTLEGGTDATAVELVGHDIANDVAVLRVPAVDDGAVTIRSGAPRPGPRYVGVVEGTTQGPVLRPVYVGRMQLVADARTGVPQLSLVALQQTIPRGAALFALDGAFIGLVRDSGETTTVLTAEFLRTAAGAAPPAATGRRVSMGLELEALTPALGTATGSDRGVIVTHVEPDGPAAKVLQSGDVIQSIDGNAVTTVALFRQLESTRLPGASVAVAGIRRRSPLAVEITAADATAATAVLPADDAGFTGRSVPGLGTEVVAVTARGAAAGAGLQRGDLIVAVDGVQNPVANEIARRYRAASPGSALLITVLRAQRHHVLALGRR